MTRESSHTPRTVYPDTTNAYLGDGVYASFDGYSVTLDLRGQDSTTRIVLDPAVLAALDEFRTAIAKAQP